MYSHDFGEWSFFFITGINLKVLSCHFSHKTGRLATEGNYEGAAFYVTSCIRDLQDIDETDESERSIGFLEELRIQSEVNKPIYHTQY